MLEIPFEHLQTHMTNRSKLGVNPHEVHRLGQRVAKVGFKEDELDICVFNEASNPQRRREQKAFNEALIKGSNGLLAPLTGKEAYNMVGGNHIIQFVRAVDYGCKTPIKELQDAEEYLDKHKLLKKGFTNKLSKNGAKVKIVRACVEEAIPDIADFCQRALNAGNSVQSECNELEIMCSIAEFAEGGADLKACTEAAISGNPPCAAYADVLAEFVRDFGADIWSCDTSSWS